MSGFIVDLAIGFLELPSLVHKWGNFLNYLELYGGVRLDMVDVPTLAF